jgi:hypothetical protein
LVWLDLSEPEARKRLAKVSGPISLRLDEKTLNNSALLQKVKTLSQKHHVGLNLGTLDTLHLGNGYYRPSNVTDAGLVHLKGLENLRVLNLRRLSNVTDAGLVHLIGFGGGLVCSRPRSQLSR